MNNAQLNSLEADRLEVLFDNLGDLVDEHGPQDVLKQLHYICHDHACIVNGCPEEAQWIMLAGAVKVLADSQACRAIDSLTPAERHTVDNAPSNDEVS